MGFSDDEEIPAGYYSTIHRPDEGSSLPEPPGPGTVLVAKAFGIVFLAAGVLFAVVQFRRVLHNHVAYDASRGYFLAQYIALVAVPLLFLVLGYALLRHGGERPRSVRRRRRDRRR